MRHHRFTNVRGIATVQNSLSGGLYRSKLERDGFIRWMLDPDVMQARMQKPRVKSPSDAGAWRSYTGDMLVDFFPSSGCRQLVVEFKYGSELKRLQEKEPARYPEIEAYLET